MNYVSENSNVKAISQILATKSANLHVDTVVFKFPKTFAKLKFSTKIHQHSSTVCPSAAFSVLRGLTIVVTLSANASRSACTQGLLERRCRPVLALIYYLINFRHYLVKVDITRGPEFRFGLLTPG